MNKQEQSIARAGAEMGAIAGPLIAVGAFIAAYTHFASGSQTPDWLTMGRIGLFVVLTSTGSYLALGGWVAFWGAIGELNIQAAERKARDQGEA